MSTLIKSLLFLLVCLASVLCLYLLIPLLKEGWPSNSVLYILGIIAILSSLLLLWHWLWTKVWRAEKGVFHFFGMVLPAIPLVIYLWIGGLTAYYLIQASILSGQVTIKTYQETPIYWPGFDQPVGISLMLQLSQPLQLSGNLLGPKIIAEKSAHGLPKNGPMASYMGYCLTPSGEYVCLTEPMRPMLPEAGKSSKTTGKYTYQLFSSNIGYMESPERLCIRQQTIKDFSGDSAPIQALWIFATEANATINLSHKLTVSIHENNSYLASFPQIHHMHLQFQASSLKRAGYDPCTLKSLHKHCYCRKSVR